VDALKTRIAGGDRSDSAVNDLFEAERLLKVAGGREIAHGFLRTEHESSVHAESHRRGHLVHHRDPRAVEAPFLDWLGDGDAFAFSTKHEYVMDYLRPHYIIASTAVASATAVTGVPGQRPRPGADRRHLLENESAAPEFLQVTSIVGANSIVVSRNYDGGGIGSLAAGGQFYVRGPAGIEGQEHSGEHTARPGLARGEHRRAVQHPDRGLRHAGRHRAQHARQRVVRAGRARSCSGRCRRTSRRKSSAAS
jgi:hypothetical protein